MDPMSLSNIPPHHGALGRLKIPKPAKCCWTLLCVTIDSIILAAALNVLPLSDTLFVGSPLRDAYGISLYLSVHAFLLYKRTLR